jgi:hypothetical protein
VSGKSLHIASFFFGLFFDLEDGGYTFLRNVCGLHGAEDSSLNMREEDSS